MPVFTDCYATSGPADVARLRSILARLPLDRIQRLALIGKTEGTATINDFSRDVAIRAAEDAIRDAGGDALLQRTTLIFSTGCEGVLSPGVDVLVQIAAPDVDAGPPRLAMGGAKSPALAARDMITPDHIRLVAQTTVRAMAEARLTPAEVALVLVKTPILTPALAAATGEPDVMARAGSSARARGAAALGVAAALGEIPTDRLEDIAIGQDTNLYATRAMAFSGTELTHNEVVVLGNRRGAGGTRIIHTSQIADILDARQLKRMFRAAGCGLDPDGELTGIELLKSVFLKAGVAPDGRVRGNRTTVFHSEVDPDKHMRSAASGVIGALLGTSRIFVSGGAEHQAPIGGGLAACIADANPTDSTSNWLE